MLRSTKLPSISTKSFGTLRNYANRAIAIRREDKNRWERRVPLVPDDVQKLVRDNGVKVYVQPSTRRVYPDEKFREAGAIVQEDISSADIILGVKEVPIPHLLDNKSYIFFSHTHKGQKYNMPMLKKILDKKINLIDYELMTDEKNKRLVLFGKFAGYAGMIDGFHALGQRLLGLGYATPFLNIGMTYMYRCLADARLDIIRSGQTIMDDCLPAELGPLTFVFTGDGNVSQGALHVFKCLPHQWVSPKELKDLVESEKYNRHKVYLCQVKTADHIIRKDDGSFNKEDYMKHPEKYTSNFHEEIAPYTSVLVNGIFWSTKHPRLITTEQAHRLAIQKRWRMLAIADISCDINGSIEFMSHASTIDHPFFMYDPITNKNHQEIEGSGVIIMSIDNLPTEMPLEASEYFSDALLPYVRDLALNIKSPVIDRATIAVNGELVGKHKNLENFISKYAGNSNISVTGSKKILVLGSGYVAAPLIDYLVRSEENLVTIASNSLSEATKLAAGRKRIEVTKLDVADTQSLSSLISAHDAVVSFVPASMHVSVAELCIANKKHMVTASYISPAMAALDERAKAAGITILNELGLDPGIDHLTAMQLFDHVKAEGGRISSFVSWCGGLPAPEASGNPLGYKFSWSPKGVLLAGLNSAKYKWDGKLLNIPGPELLKSSLPVELYKGFSLEGIPNRDSLSYLDVYNLGKVDDIQTMFRGTLRYKGYGELMSGFKDLGLFNQSPSKKYGNWRELMFGELGISNEVDLLPAIQSKLTGPAKQQQLQRVLSALDWLEALSNTNPVGQSSSVIDAFCELLQRKLVYGVGERDMVAMQHEFGIEWADGSKEKKTSTLISYGDVGGYSAMAKTVGLPAAIGTQLLLEGAIKRRGVLAPVTKDIYEPTLVKLEGEGITFTEESKKLKV